MGGSSTPPPVEKYVAPPTKNIKAGAKGGPTPAMTARRIAGRTSRTGLTLAKTGQGTGTNVYNA